MTYPYIPPSVSLHHHGDGSHPALHCVAVMTGAITLFYFVGSIGVHRAPDMAAIYRLLPVLPALFLVAALTPDHHAFVFAIAATAVLWCGLFGAVWRLLVTHRVALAWGLAVAVALMHGLIARILWGGVGP